MAWLEAGSRLAMVVKARQRAVTVYYARTDLVMLTAEETLDGGVPSMPRSLPQRRTARRGTAWCGLDRQGKEAATDGVLKTDQANTGREADGGPARQSMAATGSYEKAREAYRVAAWP